jgi:hypothetical protein
MNVNVNECSTLQKMPNCLPNWFHQFTFRSEKYNRSFVSVFDIIRIFLLASYIDTYIDTKWNLIVVLLYSPSFMSKAGYFFLFLLFICFFLFSRIPTLVFCPFFALFFWYVILFRIYFWYYFVSYICSLLFLLPVAFENKSP